MKECAIVAGLMLVSVIVARLLSNQVAVEIEEQRSIQIDIARADSPTAMGLYLGEIQHAR